MASGLYERFKANLMNKEVDLEGDVIKVALLNNSHSFTATDNTWSQVSANELASGNGYTTGGATLAGMSVTQASATKWDATDSVWTDATFVAYHAVIYQSVSGNLIASIDFGGAKTVTGGTFTVTWNIAGIVTVT